MIDAAQAVLLIVILILTVLLLVLGIQIFFILRELRWTVRKANKVLDDAGSITESVSGPISSLSTLASGIKTGALVANLLKRKSKKNKQTEEKSYDE